MCGIAGFTSSADRDSVSIILSMLSYIGHRGPDEAGYFTDNFAAMGMVRLSILDAAHGHQPMSSDDNRYWISFNGELYNYIELREALIAQGVSFKTKSDTEVVLKSWLFWGRDALAKMNGAFSFAICDTFTERLFLARDRYGKRPLFYTQHQGHFIFASEMKAFLAWDDFNFSLDPEQLASIYGHWTPLPGQTPFKGVFQLPMASWMEVDRQGHRIEKYEDLDFKVEREASSLDEAAQWVREALEESVRKRLRSDVEVGVYLSGGIDSSIVASLAASITGQPPKTFGVTFEDDDLDESSYQHLMAQHLGSEHQSLNIMSQDIVQNFPDAVYHAEMPTFRTAFVPMFLLSKMVQQSGVKTILSGEGADEVFLGYSLFRETLMRRQWEGLSLEERKRQISLLNPDIKHYNEKNSAHLLGLYQQFSQERMPGLFSHELRFQNGAFAKRLLKDNALDPFASLQKLIADDPVYASLGDIEKAQWLEFRTLLPGYLLSTQGERMGMAHGVENRCPFLDPAVVNLAGSVNPRFGMEGSAKEVLKRAFKAYLPREIVQRHKHSYRAPDSAAFVAQAPDYLEAVLSENELQKIDGLNPTFAQALVGKIMSSPPERISTRENQAFVYLLSTVLVHRQFVQRETAFCTPVRDISNRLVVAHKCLAGAA